MALAAELRNSLPAGAVDVAGTLRVRDADGRRRICPMRYRVEVEGDRWSTTYETAGGEGIPAQKVTVLHEVGRPNRYLVEDRAAGAGESVTKVLEGQESMEAFAGSDFWLADLGLEYLHWPEHRIVEELRIRRRKGRPCQILDSRNPDPAARGYSYVRSWIDRETGKPIMAEAYGLDGKVLKEFEVGAVTKVEGVWELKNLEMRNLKEDSRTLLEFEYRQAE